MVVVRAEDSSANIMDRVAAHKKMTFLLNCPYLAETRTELVITNMRLIHDHSYLEDLVRQ